jgi:hypothetical protein
MSETNILMLIAVLLVTLFFPFCWLAQRGAISNRAKDWCAYAGFACAVLGECLGFLVFYWVRTVNPSWIAVLVGLDLVAIYYWYGPEICK